MGKRLGSRTTSITPLKAYLADAHVSFNIDRSVYPSEDFLRTVTLLFTPDRLGPVIVPGLDTGREARLKVELKRYQNWAQVKTDGYRMAPLLFSFLWRFHADVGGPLAPVQQVTPFESREVRMIAAACKACRERLDSNLSAGQIFLIPDREITFGRPGRQGKPYARRVLVAAVSPDQVWLIPFSKKTGWLRADKDVIFDVADTHGELAADARPAVETFPYLLFREKTVLRVSDVQPMTRRRFLEAALVLLGSVRREALAVIHRRLKKR